MIRAGDLPTVLTDGTPARGRGRMKGVAMHVQIVTFGLNGITEEQFHEVAAGDAPAFVSFPGLLGKIWLRDPETNTYGGLYLWADREAYERYVAGEIFSSIMANPGLKNAESRLFGTFDDLSSMTMPELQVA